MSGRDYKDVKVEKKGGVGWVTFNRPDRYNACDFSMFQEVGWGIREVSEDPTIGVIVLTGAGDKSFCAGGFLKDLQNFSTSGTPTMTSPPCSMPSALAWARTRWTSGNCRSSMRKTCVHCRRWRSFSAIRVSG